MNIKTPIARQIICTTAPIIELVAKNPDKTGGVVHGIATPVGYGHNPNFINSQVIRPNTGLDKTHGINSIAFMTTGAPNTTGSEIQKVAGKTATFPTPFNRLLFDTIKIAITNDIKAIITNNALN